MYVFTVCLVTGLLLVGMKYPYPSIVLCLSMQKSANIDVKQTDKYIYYYFGKTGIF